MSFGLELVNCSGELTVIAGVAIALTWLYLYYKRKFSFWEKYGLSGPKPTLVIGNSLAYFMNPMHEVMSENCKKYGKTYGIYEGTKPLLVSSDPELIRQITVKDAHLFVNRRSFVEVFGEIGAKFLTNLVDDDWKRVRTVLTPTFTSGKMRKMFHIMENCTTDSIAAMSGYGAKSVDLKEFFGKYSLDIIARCCFATKPDSYNNPDNMFLKSAHEVFKPNLVNFALFFLLPEKLFKALNLEVFPHAPMRYFKRAVEHLMKERREKNIRGNDFLQILIDSQHEDHDEHSYEGPTELENSSKPRNEVTEDELIAQAILFLAAGYETTASLLTFAFYHMALNQDVQQRLFEEVKATKPLDYDTISSLPYLDALVHEALRMNAPAILIDREASVDYVIPGTEIKISKGTDIQFSVHRVHHDPDNYPEPEKFDPSRFLPENKDNLKPYTYLPFGAGPRNCIGMRFAYLEAKLLIARVVLSFKFDKTSETPIPPKFKAASALLVFDPIYVKVESRT